jgi:hypothetical protein
MCGRTRPPDTERARRSPPPPLVASAAIPLKGAAHCHSTLPAGDHRRDATRSSKRPASRGWPVKAEERARPPRPGRPGQRDRRRRDRPAARHLGAPDAPDRRRRPQADPTARGRAVRRRRRRDRGPPPFTTRRSRASPGSLPTRPNTSGSARSPGAFTGWPLRRGLRLCRARAAETAEGIRTSTFCMASRTWRDADCADIPANERFRVSVQSPGGSGERGGRLAADAGLDCGGQVGE